MTMFESGWPDGPSRGDFISWYIWLRFIAPRIKLPNVQKKIVPEKELTRFLDSGWNFVTHCTLQLITDKKD